MTADGFGLACECHLEGELVRADVRTVSQTGFVVETTAPFVQGDEFELRLVGGAARQPIYLRAVVEGHVAHSALGTQSHPGVRFRLLGFSPDYGRLIAGARESESSQAPARERKRNRPERKASEREWLTGILSEEDARPAKARESSFQEWSDYEPLLERAGEPLWAEDSLAPEAIVIDDGELDDIVRALAQLGVKAERQSPDTESILTSWIPPQRLLVVSAKRAMKLRLPLLAMRRGFVSIAVADSDARTTCATISRLGYQFAISRPIHPLAMSMILQQAMFPGDDRRLAPREVLCCSVRWWCRWKRKQPGLIVNVSQGGCQLLVRDQVPKGALIKIQVPGAVAGGRGFTLAGQVRRSSPSHDGTTLGISFDPLSHQVQRRLQQILALPGPCRVTDEAMSFHGDAAGSGPEETQASAPKQDRRENRRVAMREEVIGLEHDSGRVMHLLVGSDLTVDGIRVEAHPSLALDERLDLALFGGPEGAPLIVSAVVARDDGRRGWWLRFLGITPRIEQHLEDALNRFPPVTRLDEEQESARVVLGQLAIQPEAREDDEPD